MFQDRGGVGERLCGVLRQLGFHVTQVYASNQFESIAKDQFGVNPERIEDFRKLLHDRNALIDAGCNIVYLWGLDVAPTSTLNTKTSPSAHSSRP